MPVPPALEHVLVLHVPSKKVSDALGGLGSYPSGPVGLLVHSVPGRLDNVGVAGTVRSGRRLIWTLTKIGNGVLRFYRATDGMGIKGTIDRTILPVILDYLG